MERSQNMNKQITKEKIVMAYNHLKEAQPH